MLGYYRDEEATRNSVTPEGWMRTGDLATFDEEGYCSIVGRIKDTIIRGGENIAPREVNLVSLCYFILFKKKNSFGGCYFVPVTRWLCDMIHTHTHTQVEDALFEHSAIENVTVVGVPSDIYGEDVCACVVLKVPLSDEVESDIKHHCKKRLSHFKVPKYFRFITNEEIPMTVSGKIQKHVLSKTCAKELGLVK
jgi:fatty-acyl-CoA synthase